MNSSRFLMIGAVLGAALLVGCTTPEARIREHPEVFARLNPDQQALVRGGQVAVGFDMEAVKLALGDPDHITLHTSATGQTQVWHYVTYGLDGPYFYGGYGYYRGGWGPYRHGWGRGAWGYGGMWGPDYVERAYERIRVTFDQSARVTAIQQEMP